ncbi:MAG: ribonuclease Z [Eubacteriales bacterium]|nr:ribonuclease Z [Eubacteriales bacterium]
MLDVTLLGTGGMMPLPNRHLTSLLVRLDGSSLLIDCGEGTQIALAKANLSPNPIDIILITHFHADHISGLIGLLLSMGNSDRREKITIVGPKDIEKVVSSLRIIAPQLPFKIEYIELKNEKGILNIGKYNIEYFKLKHKITCYGYSILVPRLPEFQLEKAKENNIPLKYWNKLQHGEIIYDKENEKTYKPSDVMGEEREGLKLTYLTDTRPVKIIEEMAKNANLFICEGMYGESDKDDNAKEYMHMTMKEAIKIGVKINPKEMWLTHYSPSEMKPQKYLEEFRRTLPQLFIPKDGWHKELKFED